MEDGTVVTSWRELIKYKNLMPMMDPKVEELFDVLQELIPIIWNYDRVGTFLRWKDKAYKAKLITPWEESLIINEMIHGCGGM